VTLNVPMRQESPSEELRVLMVPETCLRSTHMSTKRCAIIWK